MTRRRDDDNKEVAQSVEQRVSKSAGRTFKSFPLYRKVHGLTHFLDCISHKSG